MKYRLNIKKVSGDLKGSSLPKKSLVIETKTKKSKKSIINECEKYLKKNYGLSLESFDVEEMRENEVNGYVYVKYNSQWGHYSLAWESESGDFITEDDDSINHVVGGFKEPFNNVDWFVDRVATCLEDGTCSHGIRFVIENGAVAEEQYDY